MQCGAATSGGKPYCEEHILLIPYAARLHREVERRQAKLKAARADARQRHQDARARRAARLNERQRRYLLQSLADALAKAARTASCPPPVRPAPGPAAEQESTPATVPPAPLLVEWSWVPTDVAMDQWGIRCWRCQVVEPVPFVAGKDARDQVVLAWRAHHECRPGMSTPDPSAPGPRAP